MVDFAPRIRKSMPNKDGSYNIKIIITANSTQSFMSIPYKITSLSEWKDGRGIRRQDAEYINSYLLTASSGYVKYATTNEYQPGQPPKSVNGSNNNSTNRVKCPVTSPPILINSLQTAKNLIQPTWITPSGH